MSDSFAQEILDTLTPMLYDPATAPLTSYVEGLSSVFQLIEDWASDTDTAVGWSLLVDVDRCPSEALPWLAQLVGVRLTGGLSAADQRQQIKSLANWKRGTPAAIEAAPAPYLTGTKTVILRERYDGSGNDAPAYLEVITYTSETADAVAAEAAIRAQKPAGLILTYNIIDGQDLQQVKDNYATLQDVKNAYVTLQGVKSNLVGT